VSTVHCDPGPPAAPAGAPTRPETARIVLIGNPNTGKTTLFNRLCGTRAKTSNFPGTTTSVRTGRAVVGSDTIVEILDLPGLYQLSLDVPEARIARDVLGRKATAVRDTDAILVVVDACNLTRNLMLTGELLAYGLPVVVALNMVDLAQRRGLSLDAERLTQHLGCRVVPIVARRGVGVDELRRVIGDVLELGAADSVAPVERAASVVWLASSCRTSDSRNRRCPPGVLIDPIAPAAAHLVTVFGSTRKSRATSPGVNNGSTCSMIITLSAQQLT